MGCLTVILRRVGNMTAAMTRLFGDTVGSATRICDTEVTISRIGGIEASASRVGSMTCRMGLVCTAGLEDDVLWASDGRVLNVYGGYIYITKKW